MSEEYDKRSIGFKPIDELEEELDAEGKSLEDLEAEEFGE